MQDDLTGGIDDVDVAFSEQRHGIDDVLGDVFHIDRAGEHPRDPALHQHGLAEHEHVEPLPVAEQGAFQRAVSAHGLAEIIPVAAPGAFVTLFGRGFHNAVPVLKGQKVDVVVYADALLQLVAEGDLFGGVAAGFPRGVVGPRVEPSDVGFNGLILGEHAHVVARGLQHQADLAAHALDDGGFGGDDIGGNDAFGVFVGRPGYDGKGNAHGQRDGHEYPCGKRHDNPPLPNKRGCCTSKKGKKHERLRIRVLAVPYFVRFFTIVLFVPVCPERWNRKQAGKRPAPGVSGLRRAPASGGRFPPFLSAFRPEFPLLRQRRLSASHGKGKRSRAVAFPPGKTGRRNGERPAARPHPVFISQETRNAPDPEGARSPRTGIR